MPAAKSVGYGADLSGLDSAVPSTTERRKHQVSTRLTERELDALDRAVERQHTSRADLARRLVLGGIEALTEQFEADPDGWGGR